jgi:hypothetical protein
VNVSRSEAERGGVSASSIDPLTLFITNHRCALPASRGRRFNAGEHAWLGSHGAERACDELQKTRGIVVSKSLFESIRRRTGREELQYGELVALSGDFYETPDELFDEKPSPLPWLWESNDLSDLRQLFAKELQWIEARRAGRGGTTYPDENIRLAWNAKSYVELALRNTDHFGWHNILAYCRHHGEALKLATDAAGRENETFRRALYTNAFADHFLTDGFAAGHIRVPRAEIRDWAQGKGLSEKIAGALSKLLHDQDGHIDLESLHGVVEEDKRKPGDGLAVRNANGVAWHTYCDGYLFLHTASGESAAIDEPVNAVCASVIELLLAWKLREIPRGVYAATRFVPFPSADAPALIQKFSADMPAADFDRLWENVSWYAKIPWLVGFERQNVLDLLATLPQIMADFRAHVAADAGNVDITTRIDPRYIEAYRRIA